MFSLTSLRKNLGFSKSGYPTEIRIMEPLVSLENIRNMTNYEETFVHVAKMRMVQTPNHGPFFKMLTIINKRGRR